MADEEDVNEEDGVEGEEEDFTEGLDQRKFTGKKIIIIAGVAIILIAGIVGFLMMGGDHEPEGEEHVAEEGLPLDEDGNPIPPQIVFYDLPEMLVNLNTGSRQASYLKVQIALELSDPLAIPTLDQLAPRIIDIFQVYLRELRLEDLDGSAGMFRLKEELLKRANASVAPIEIRDILFREMLVQ
jgi:flagellar protein FliL